MATFIVTADSLPVYKDWPWSSAWDCEEWVLWHKALLGKYTPDEADYLWSKAWLDGVSRVSGGNGTATGSGYITDSVPLSCRTFDSNFKAYLDEHTNLKAAVFSGIGGLIAKPLTLGVTVIDAAGNVISNTANGISNFSGTLKWLIPVILILVLLGVFIYFNRKYKLISV